MNKITDIVLLKKCIPEYTIAHQWQKTGMNGILGNKNTFPVINLTILKEFVILELDS